MEKLKKYIFFVHSFEFCVLIQLRSPPTESCPLTGVTFPHVLPLLFLMEKKVAMAEGADLWEVMEVNVDVVMFHLGAARTIAQLGGIYQSNTETKLQGKRYR